MKKYLLTAVTTALLLVPGVQAADVEVEWVEPEKFRDVKPGDNMGRKRFREKTLERFEKHFAELAKKLPEGQKLSLKVTNVDLAGDVRPWHNGNWIRIIKSPYAPMLKFSYTLSDASGAELKSGDERLRDLGFDLSPPRAKVNEPLKYEKHMIDEWFGDTFSELYVKK